jgi:hypothetical protein
MFIELASTDGARVVGITDHGPSARYCSLRLHTKQAGESAAIRGHGPTAHAPRQSYQPPQWPHQRQWQRHTHALAIHKADLTRLSPKGRGVPVAAQLLTWATVRPP